MTRWDERIRDEHEALRAQAEDLSAVLSMSTTDPESRRSALVWLLRNVGATLDAHLQQEERAGFPALAQLLGSDANALVLLRTQHREVRAALAALHRRCERPWNGDAALQWDAIQREGAFFVSLLEDHEQKIERLLIDVLEYSLPTQALHHVGQAFLAESPWMDDPVEVTS